MLWNSIAFDRTALTRIRSAFRSSEFIVIAYLRPVDDHVLSAYAQRVTGSQRFAGSFNEHVSELIDNGWYDYDKRLDDFASVFGRESIRPVWLPWLKRDVLSPFREIFPELAEVPTANELNARRSWLNVAASRRLNVFQGGGTRRLSSFSRQILRRFDPLAKNFPTLDRKFNPMDANTKRPLEMKTFLMLDKLADKFGMSND